MSTESASPYRIEPLDLRIHDATLLRALDVATAAAEHTFDPVSEGGRDCSRAWIAQVDQDDRARPVAYLVTWHVADELHILNVATSPPFRRRGIARALMDQALEYARSHAIRIVVLEVRRSNAAAIRLYRTLGFFVTSLRRNYYNDNGEDALDMMLVLDPETGHIVPGRDDVRLEEAT
jgi:ribosomal-protein-alanine N-acetyltransferase